MKTSLTVAIVLVLPLIGNTYPVASAASENVLLAQGQCSKRMGPYQSQYAAQQEAQAYQSQGYSTSGVWGEGGVVSSWSNRRYFFNLFYSC